MIRADIIRDAGTVQVKVQAGHFFFIITFAFALMSIMISFELAPDDQMCRKMDKPEVAWACWITVLFHQRIYAAGFETCIDEGLSWSVHFSTVCCFPLCAYFPTMKTPTVI